MDAMAPLAGQVVAILAPFLPHLAAAGQKVAAGVGKELEGTVGDVAKALWDRLYPRIEARPAAREAAQDAADRPDDQDAQAALRVQLRKLLADDSALAEEVTRLLQENRPAGAVTNVAASGAGAVAVGRDVPGGTIVTGDRNRFG